jgi:altronate dehydratase small subunit
MSRPRCFPVHADDNVATLLDDVSGPGAVGVLNTSSPAEVEAREPIQLGHKIALQPIAPGAAIIKYGVSIGRATRAIAVGEWVHLHNCASGYDARSQTLDVHTGATTDTRYE